MSPFDVIVIVAVSVATLTVIGVTIYKKVTKKGSTCGCGCSSCSACSSCPSANKTTKKKA